MGTRGFVGAYRPVALAKSWPLDKLPSRDEFLAAVEGEDDE